MTNTWIESTNFVEMQDSIPWTCDDDLFRIQHHICALIVEVRAYTGCTQIVNHVGLGKNTTNGSGNRNLVR